MDVVAQSRVWNWVIDVVAWCGHYKPKATNLQNDFVVEREQHYWVHPPSVAAATYGEAGVAIDRYTGQVLDKQIEVVTE